MPAQVQRVAASVGDDYTVFVVDPDQTFSDSLTLVLGYRGYGLRHFNAPDDFLALRAPHWRGCVLASLDLPVETALALFSSGMPVVFMTVTGELSRVRRAFIAGAVDVLPKPVAIEELLEAVERGIDRARQQAPDHPPRVPASSLQGGLSRREAEVAALVRQGHGNRSIAEQLGISHRTVEVHKTRLMRKLGVHSLAELIALPEPVATKRRSRVTRRRTVE